MSLLPIALGDGQAPDVTIVDGLVYAAVPLSGVLHLDVFNAVGARVLTKPVAGGFESSYPRFHREWLIYKAYPTWAPVVMNLRTGDSHTFEGYTVDGGCFVDADRQLAVWETAQPGGLLRIFVGSLLTWEVMQTALLGAPDGIERFNPDGSILCRKDIATIDPAVGGFPSQSGDLTVGQYGYGIGVRLGGDPVRWLLGGSVTKDPRCAAAGGMNAIVCWGAGVRLVIATDDELRMLPWTIAGPDPVTPPDPVKPPPAPEVPVYQRRSPDYTSFVRDTAALYPDLWEAARKRPDGTRDDRFIRVLAADLHAHDPKVGLNGKRGGDEISTDALAYQNDTAENGAEVIDVITGSHEPAWGDVTLNGRGKWIAPSAASTTGGTTPPPVDASFAGAASALERRLAALEAKDAAQAAEIAALKARPIGGGSVSLDGLRITLRTDDGSLMTAENGGGGEINAKGPRPFGGWQVFRVEVQE